MKALIVVLALLGSLTSSTPARAQPEALDGPVVGAAREALKTGDVSYALVWVRPEHEQEIRAAFSQTVAVRRLGRDARALADRYFFETLVRVHRTGEGQPYTGLIPAGADPGPAITAAERALETGSPSALVSNLTWHVREGVHRRLEYALALRRHRPGDLERGRAYVAAYVELLRYVDEISEVARRPTRERRPERQASAR